MADLQASWRGQTISGADGHAKLMSNINRLIFDTSPSNRYATFFYGQYEPSSRQFTYVNGGHTDAIGIKQQHIANCQVHVGFRITRCLAKP
jgi:sigma-B regulation protein RsbU (phosphoserine phosphatase)